MGATVNKKKCMFFVKEIINKNRISFNGIHLNPYKINTINELPGPRDLKQLQSFLGINYYSKFIPNMADIANHFNVYLKKTLNGNGLKLNNYHSKT